MTVVEYLRQIEQLEAQCALLAAGLRAVKLSLEEAAKPAEAPPEEGPDGGCLHPAGAREPAPAMGKANRFLCRRCRQVVG